MIVPDFALHQDFKTLIFDGRLLPEVFHEIMSTGQFVDGKYVEQLENELAEFSGAEDCCVLACGTDALEAAIAVKYADAQEIYIPALTFEATRTACRGLERLRDVSESTGLMPPCDASVPVDLYGRVVPRKFAKVFDACQSFGSTPSMVGAEYLECYSFFPTKPLGGCGFGGAVAGARSDVETIRRWRKHQEGGRNSRMSELEAAFLLAKLRRFRTDREHVQQIASYYLTNIENPIIRLPSFEGANAWHRFPVRVPAQSRPNVVEKLRASGIGAVVRYPALGARPNAVKWASEVVCLPLWADMRAWQMRYVVDKCNALA